MFVQTIFRTEEKPRPKISKRQQYWNGVGMQSCNCKVAWRRFDAERKLKRVYCVCFLDSGKEEIQKR